mgnify:CR=1 FL=1
MTQPLRIGVLRLADSAPVIIAHNHGFFEKHGVKTEIVVSPSWANIADGLVWKNLDSALIFPPLAIMTTLGHRGHNAHLKPLMAISRGGNTIIFRGDNPMQGLWSPDIAGRAAFDAWCWALGRKPRLAVVHMYSTHLLILRRFLAMIGVDMDTEIELLVMPPANMINALAQKAIDGGCVGPSWGTEACLQELAFLVGGSSSVLPGHVEKLFVVSDATAERHTDGLRNALHEAIAYCQNPDNSVDIARELALPVEEGGLELPERATLATLTEGVTSETMTFTTQPFTLHDCAWIEADMTRLHWIDAAETARIDWWQDRQKDLAVPSPSE